MDTYTAEKYAKLQELLDSGVIWIENGSYVGIASDGQEVILGDTFHPTGTNAYLTDFPNPSDW